MSSPRLIYSIYENRLRNKLINESLPKHIGLIHDGHRRYARKERLLSFEVSYKIGMTRLCLLYTSPSPRDVEESRMPSSA